MANEVTWRKVIEKVLSEATGAVHYKDLTEKIIADGLRSNLGATPASTVSAHLTTAIRNEGSDYPFQKIWKRPLHMEEEGRNCSATSSN